MSYEFKVLRKALKDKIPYIKDVSLSNKGDSKVSDYIDVVVDKDILTNEYGLDDVFTFPMTTKHIDALLDDDYYLEEDIMAIVNKIHISKHIPREHRNEKTFRVSNYIIL